MKITAQNLEGLSKLFQDSKKAVTDAEQVLASAATKLEAVRKTHGGISAAFDVLSNSFRAGEEVSDAWLKAAGADVQKALGWTAPVTPSAPAKP
jgi:hypothetical protein